MKTIGTILLILAMSLTAATGVFAGGRVLCVGEDQHVAIELRHQRCSAPVADHASHDEGAVLASADADHAPSAAVAAAAGRSCIDYELPAGTIAGGTSVRSAATDAVLLPFLMPAALWDANLRVFAATWYGPPIDDLPSSCLSRLRGIILLT